MRITWVGHSTALIEDGETRVITDPLLRGRVLHLNRYAPGHDPDHERVDGVLISHLHYDHLDMPSLALLGRETPIVVPRGGGELLRRRRFLDVREVSVGHRAQLGALEVRAVPARHHGRRLPLVGASAPALGYVVSGSRRVYFLGDTDLFDDMVVHGGDADVALVPIWGWGPKLGPGHLDPVRAVEALVRLAPRIAIPIHYGTYAPVRRGDAGPHYLTTPLAHFLDLAATRVPHIDIRPLAPGDSTEV